MWKKYQTHVFLHLIIFIWGFTGILGKLIHLEAFVLVWFRLLIAFLSLGLYLVFFKKIQIIKSKKDFYLTVFTGILALVHWLTFYKSIQLSTASLGILCLSTATIHITWMQPLLLKKKFSWIEFLMALFIIYGIYFVSNDFSATEYEALFYGLFSALCASGFNVLNEKLVQNISSGTLTFYELLSGFLVLTTILVFQNKMNLSIFDMSWGDFYWLLFLGIVCTSLAFLFTIDIIKKLGSYTVSLSINMEPVYTIILAVILLNEHTLLNTSFYIGAVFIIIIVFANAIIKNYQRKKNEKILQKPD
ncbi:MAG: DMT family transporter [Flavobacteriia bacterium]|nr:DMT family transporter [Flavobacteriia bacterium]